MDLPAPFGRYILLEKIASGGMAEIFLAKLAEGTGSQNPCVIKRIHARFSNQQDAVEMFLDEAKIAARLVHPGIVEILDLGKDADDYFIALEYLAGEDLWDALVRARRVGVRFPVDLALWVIACAAEALHFAHEAKNERGAPLNVVHRDISPSNLFISYRGGVKVLDFGIAWAAERIHHTRVRTLKGKPSYMAPEQVMGIPVDRRSDIWSLGVCLHEMLSGSHLFLGADTAEIMTKVLKAEVTPIQSLRADTPADVVALLDAILEADRDDRPATAEEVARRLKAAMTQPGGEAMAAQLGAFVRGIFDDERVARKEARRIGQVTPVLPNEVATGPGTGPPRSEDDKETGPAWSAQPPEPTEPQPEPRTQAAPRGALDFSGGRSLRRWAIGGATMGTLLGLGTWALVDRSPAPEKRLASNPVEAPRSPLLAPTPTMTATASPELTSAPEPPVAKESRPAPTPAPAPAPSRPAHASPKTSVGWLSLASNESASVFLDGERVGEAPLKRVPVPAGDHQVRLENAKKGLRRLLRVTIRPGEEVLRDERFERSSLSVMVEPWADVYLDGIKVGQTPLMRQVLEGHHLVRLVGPSGEKTLGVDVTPGTPALVKERLSAGERP